MAKAKVDNELVKAEEQFKQFDENVKSLTLDRMNQAPKEDVEPQTKLSSKDLDKAKDIYLKPIRKVASTEKFNERFRSDYEHAKEYVNFIAEHREIIGDDIDVWTKPYPGLPAEYWIVPTNKPVWGPRYLAEQIKRSTYHRLKMTNQVTEVSNFGTAYGAMAVDTTVQRLDAIPVSKKRSIFMNASGF
jgi:hypothetical protein